MTKPTKWHVRPVRDSDQPGHPPSLIRVFTVRMKKACVLSYPLSAQRRLWSDRVDAQADLSLCWAHMPFCWFCQEEAHIINPLYLSLLWNMLSYQEYELSQVKRKPVFAICEQQRHRSACTSAQSDQHLCCSLPGWNNTSSCYSQNFKTLASIYSWAGTFESYLVENPEDRSHDGAQLQAVIPLRSGSQHDKTSSAPSRPLSTWASA